MNPRPCDPLERGAALLAVLLLVAIMAVLAGLMLDRLGLATRLAANAEAQAAAQRGLAEGEARLMAELAAGGRSGQGIWRVPRGQVAWRLDPGGNCFNVNALVEAQDNGALHPRAAGLMELRALMASLGMQSTQAAPLADAMADWIDSDGLALPAGAEDDTYRRQSPVYATAGRPLLAVGELRAVRGMTPALFARLSPWLCALPEVGTSPVAMRSLVPGQGRLLAMFAPDALPVARAEQIIAQAPPGGYADLASALGPAQGLGMGEMLLSDRWLRAQLVATIDSQLWREEVLIDAGRAVPQIVSRTWGDPADE